MTIGTISQNQPEKRTNYKENLQAFLTKAEETMETKGLKEDVAILKKTQDRFLRYIDSIKEKKMAFEKDLNSGKKVEVIRLLSTDSKYQISGTMPITHEIEKGGGGFYLGAKGLVGIFEPNKIDKANKLVESTNNGEFINYSLSEEGQKILSKEFEELLGYKKKSCGMGLAEERKESERKVYLRFSEDFLNSLA